MRPVVAMFIVKLSSVFCFVGIVVLVLCKRTELTVFDEYLRSLPFRNK